jgi:signal transduction histidine kinase/CheY-like chemotaxis protein
VVLIYAQSETEELEQRIAASSAVALSLVAFGAFWAVMVGGTTDLVWAVTGIAVAGCGLGLWRWSERQPRAMIGIELALMIAAAGVTYVALDWPFAGFCLVVPLCLAATVLPPRYTLALTAAVLALLCFVPPGLPISVRLEPMILIAVVLLFQVPALLALRGSMSRSWAYGARAADLAEEARHQRGEVLRLNKALDLAYSLIQRHYAQLATARWEAERARHLKEQFAAHVSHELRTPLNIILGFLDVMQRYPEVYGDVQWTPMLRRDIAEIQRSARHLSDLVDDILDMARIEALKMPLHREPVALQEVMREAIEIAARLVGQKDVDMGVIATGDLPELMVDRTRIRQVLLNLLANASRFTDHGEICVRAERQGEEVIVSVADTGLGIAPEHLDTLFGEFPRESVQEGTRAGKGLGLAIAKRFVEMHGGRIWAVSDVGLGSTFYFSLPVETKEVGLLGRPSPLQERIFGASSIIVVDTGGGAGYLRRRMEGYEVVSVTNLEQAYDLARERRPDLLLLNAPPDPEGAAAGAPPPIVADGTPLVQCSLPVGGWLVDRELFDEWLVKPVTREHLLGVIERHCPEGRLLLVDDDRGFVQLIRRLLQTDGDRYQLQWAYTAEEALDKLSVARYDLLLLDIALPGLDGRSMAKAVHNDSRAAPMPIVALSASPPGPDTGRHRPCTFALTRGGGLSEDEVLDLIRYTLERVRPRQASGLPAAAFPATPNASPVS